MGDRQHDPCRAGDSINQLENLIYVLGVGAESESSSRASSFHDCFQDAHRFERASLADGR
jgi:hypothetical protein